MEEIECGSCEKVINYKEEDEFTMCDIVEGQYIEYWAILCPYCDCTIEI